MNQQANPLKVLIVEDDGFLREIYLESLNNQGYQLATAIDGEDAIAKITQGGWDLVLLDIVMPKMDGLDVIRKIKSDSRYQGVQLYKKLVFLTNLDNDIDMNEAKKLGEGYIVKSSITPGELVNKVKGYLSADPQPQPVTQTPQENPQQ
jgi:CheY-like chemotaxis protein